MYPTISLCCWYSERRIADRSEAVRRLSAALGVDQYGYVRTLAPLRNGPPEFVLDLLPGKLSGWLVRSGSGQDWHDVPTARVTQLCRKHPGLSMSPNFPQSMNGLVEPAEQYTLPESIRGEFCAWLDGWWVGPHEWESIDPFLRDRSLISHFSVCVCGRGFPNDPIEWMRWWQRSESFRRIDEIVQSAVGPMKFAWNWFLGGERPADFPAEE